MRQRHSLLFLYVPLYSALIATIGCSLKVKESDLVGQWHPMQNTMSALHVSPGNNTLPELDLLEDGSFVGKSLPCTIVYRGWEESTCAGKPVTGRGKWWVSKDQSDTLVNLRFISAHYGDFVDSEPTQARLYVDKEGAFHLFTWEDEEYASERLQWSLAGQQPK